MLGDNGNIKNHIQAIKNSGPLKQCGTHLVVLLICMFSTHNALHAPRSFGAAPVSELQGTKGKVGVYSWVREVLWYRRKSKEGVVRENCCHCGDQQAALQGLISGFGSCTFPFALGFCFVFSLFFPFCTYAVMVRARHAWKRMSTFRVLTGSVATALGWSWRFSYSVCLLVGLFYVWAPTDSPCLVTAKDLDVTRDLLLAASGASSDPTFPTHTQCSSF